MVEKVNRLIKLIKIRQIAKICRYFALPSLILSLCSFSFNAAALSFISDDESETLVQNIVKPIFGAAGITFNPNKILIANDNTLNAFVSDGNYLVIHSGTLMNADNVNELNGILAQNSAKNLRSDGKAALIFGVSIKHCLQSVIWLLLFSLKPSTKPPLVCIKANAARRRVPSGKNTGRFHI